MKYIILSCVFLVFMSVEAQQPIRRNSRFFNQFARQEGLPQTYGPPSSQPDKGTVATESVVTTTENDSETIDANRARKLNEFKRKEKLIQEKGDAGVYYIYHPSGLLQKVSYSTQDNAQQMAFSAKLKYENVETISGPVYTYDPTTYVFKRLQ